jgi:Uma2 family endonuclease
MPAVPRLPIHRFTVDEYHKMCAIGVLTAAHRVELIHGWIVSKMGTNPPHNYAVTAVMEQFLALSTIATVRVQQPITTADSEPEPDVVLAKGTKANYKNRNPEPADCLVVVEVADSSLQEDRTTKLKLYAGAKVPVYWIVNLRDRCVEVYTQPRGGKNPTYKTRTIYAADDRVPVAIPTRELGMIAVNELLP